MKKQLLGIVALAAFVARADVDLNGSWSFRFEEGKAIEETSGPAFEATDTMSVPGCYDTMPQWFLKRGTGLYRRTFTLERPVANAWLVVDGMGLRVNFQIDGKDLGTHPYPYARLEVETGPLAAGEHTIYAALDNRFDWKTTKLARQYYDFYFYGGFYHGVRLALDNRKLFVRTRDYKTGTVEIEAVNFTNGDFDGTLVFDGKNEVKATFRNFRATVRVPNFKLWSPSSPNLHTVTLRPQHHNTSTSQHLNITTPQHLNISTRFGIRTVEAKDRQILLNGKPVFLKGVNRHESHIEVGAATSDAQMLRDLQLIKGLGANFIRGAHYQQAPRFLDLCDEMGILVWEESLGWGNGKSYTMHLDKVDELADPEFVAEQVRQTREMVRASFNHPSVILAGFLNECASNRKGCKELVDQLIAAIKSEDAGRLVTFACNGWYRDICHSNTDVVAFNTYPGTIPNQPGLPDELAEKVRNLDPKSDGSAGFNVIARHFRAQYPEKPIIVSECGVGALYGYHDPMACVGSEEFQDEYLTDILQTIQDNKDIVGYAIWQFADIRSYHRNSNRHNGKLFGISIAGIFSQDRQPKKAAETVRRAFTEWWK
jgi:beta-glucuronidase